MTNRKDGRKIISVTMQPELHDELVAICRKLDQPMVVFVRDAVRARIQQMTK